MIKWIQFGLLGVGGECAWIWRSAHWSSTTFFGILGGHFVAAISLGRQFNCFWIFFLTVKLVKINQFLFFKLLKKSVLLVVILLESLSLRISKVSSQVCALCSPTSLTLKKLVWFALGRIWIIVWMILRWIWICHVLISRSTNYSVCSLSHGWWSSYESIIIGPRRSLHSPQLSVHFILSSRVNRRASLFESLCIAQSVQSVISGGTARTNARKHDNLHFITCQERISQNHSQFTLSKRHMLALTCLPLLLVYSSDALFQPKQTFVDFGPFNLPIFGVFNTIAGSFRSCQIDKQKFTALFDALFLYLDLTNGVRSTWSVVAFSCMCRSYLVPLIYQFQYLFLRRDEVFSQAMNLYLLVFVFKDL